MDEQLHYRWYTTIRDGGMVITRTVKCRCSRIFSHHAGEEIYDRQVSQKEEETLTTTPQAVSLLHGDSV